MTRTRSLTDAEHKALAAGRLLLCQEMPYWATAAYRMVPVAVTDGSLSTMAVDKYWRLYLCPEFLLSLDPATCAADLAHELNHLIRAHAERAKAIGANSEAWNLAGDAESNDDLIAAGLALQEWAVTPASLGCEDGLTAEEYYAAIAPQSSAQQSGGAAGGEPGGADGGEGGGADAEGCGSGAGAKQEAWELPAPGAGGGSEVEGVSEGEATVIRHTVAQAVVAHAAAKGRGSVPAGLERWAGDQLAPSKIDWRKELSAAVRRAVAWKPGKGDTTFARPSRRRVPGVVLPGSRRPLPRVLAAIDTSGSMNQADLTAALSEVQGVLRQVGIKDSGLSVISVDASATEPVMVRDARKVRLVGGGGTDMGVAVAYAESLRVRPDALIVLTDGFTPWPDAAPSVRTVVCVIGSAQEGPEWATTVHVPSGAAA